VVLEPYKDLDYERINVYCIDINCDTGDREQITPNTEVWSQKDEFRLIFDNYKGYDYEIDAEI
jgi:hypothetical protein